MVGLDSDEMSQIVTEICDAFRAAGVDDATAKAAAGAPAGRDDLVTRLDLERAVVSRLEGDLKLLKFGYGALILGLIELAFFP